MQLNRRTFLEIALASAGSAVANAQSQYLWGGPVLDVHFHTRATPAADLAHLDGCGVTRAVLLTRAQDEPKAKAAIAKEPSRFTWFASANITQPDALPQLRSCVKDGAKGFGEIKFHVPLDGPEMRGLYELAAELHVPITIHFQEDSDGGFSTGFTRLPTMLKAYPKTTFIGHANLFWASISADVPPDIAYPTGKVKPGGLTDRMLSEFPNLYADMSANSGRNALTRDPDFAAKFVERHKDKLMFGCDCSCTDGHGTGQQSKEPALKGKCVARETLTALKRLASPALFHRITWENGNRLLSLPT